MIVSEGLNNEHIMSAYSYGSLENICIKRKRKQKNQLFSLSNLTKISEYNTSRHKKKKTEAVNCEKICKRTNLHTKLQIELTPTFKKTVCWGKGEG